MNSRLPALLLLSLLIGAVPLSARSHYKKVLLVNSYHYGYLWSDRIMEGFSKSISSMEDVEVYYEFLDTKRIHSSAYMENLKKLMGLKYRKSDFDVIVVSDDNGFNLLLDIHDSIFKKAPVVFCGINDYRPSMLKGHVNITGVAETYDPLDTLKAARHIFPDKNLYISITDKTKSGTINQKLFLEAVKRIGGNISYEVWDNLSADELEDKIQRVPDHALVVFTEFNRDRKGMVVDRSTIMKILEKSSVPVLGRQEWLIDHGLFGGMIVSGFFQGKTAAEMTARVLRGEEINLMPVEMKSANRYMFDYKIMKKFHVGTGDVPSGSIIVNKPEGFFQFYHEHRVFILFTAFLSALVVIAFMTVSIVKINRLNKERKKLIEELSSSLSRIKRLDGLLPICASCKKIRNDDGYWEQIEHYLHEHSDADFSHTVCEECAIKLYPDLDLDKEKNN